MASIQPVSFPLVELSVMGNGSINKPDLYSRVKSMISCGRSMSSLVRPGRSPFV